MKRMDCVLSESNFGSTFSEFIKFVLCAKNIFMQYTIHNPYSEYIFVHKFVYLGLCWKPFSTQYTSSCVRAYTKMNTIWMTAPYRTLKTFVRSLLFSMKFHLKRVDCKMDLCVCVGYFYVDMCMCMCICLTNTRIQWTSHIVYT